MFRFLFKKQRRIEKLFFSYLEMLRITQDHFYQALNGCIERGGVCEKFDFLTGQTHKYESRADDIREEIKALMYGKALLPESRGDIMGLLEAMDEIPRLFERILQMIATQRLAIPDSIGADIAEMIEISLESCNFLYEEVEAVFSKNVGIRSLLSKIDHNESECDHIERRLISEIFASDLDPFLKLQIKDLILEMGEITDQADRVAKRVNIISLKRRV